MTAATPSFGGRAIDMVVDRGLVPDRLLRLAIRTLLWGRRRAASQGGVEGRSERRRALLRSLRTSPVAVGTHEANDQHYEVPAAFFEVMLGPRLKYSSAFYPSGVVDLEQAEQAMLTLTCERAGLDDGQDILELGCGWGSLTLWIAQRYPGSRVTAVSNSATQRRYIERLARDRGIGNVTVVTCDVNRLGLDSGLDAVGAERFDRVVSIEMFEHVRNHTELTNRIAGWLRPGGRLFIHVFAHRSDAYLFEVGSAGDWMARHFFTGGVMPSDDLLLHTVRDLTIEDHWVLSGQHYARTLRAWLDRLDQHRDEALACLAAASDPHDARVQLRRWRVFTIACEELFACRDGNEWHVSHYLFTR